MLPMDPDRKTSSATWRSSAPGWRERAPSSTSHTRGPGWWRASCAGLPTALTRPAPRAGRPV